jgi:hypothetical protein
LHERERRGGDVDEEKEEDLNAGEDGRGVGGEFDVDFVADAKYESVGGKKECPEKEGAFLSGPEGCELIFKVQRAVGVLRDVGDAEVVGVGGAVSARRSGDM